MVEDTPETAAEATEVEQILTALKREAGERKQKRSAERAQREDDLALPTAMALSAAAGSKSRGGEGSTGSSGSTEAVPDSQPAAPPHGGVR